MKASINPNFWKGKRVFLTGHTGFKGSWMSLWLNSLGAEVKGYSLTPPTEPSLFLQANINRYIDSKVGDIRDLELLSKEMSAFNPDIIFHMAAQPLVRLSYTQPVETYSTNVMGTVNVLESARRCKNLAAIVNITTDKCYENREWEWGYRENEPMGGHDPYSNSKGCAELVTSAYRKSFFNSSASALLGSGRAGNVIGGGDWAADRLIPDILNAFEKQQPVVIRNPKATRPWQHVLEPLSGYLVLAQSLCEKNLHHADGWNFGPRDEDVEPVEWILERMVNFWGEGASWQLDSRDQPHEAKYLKLDISKARVQLGWQPTWRLEETLKKIVAWHQAWLSNEKMDIYSLNEIQSYMNDM